MKLIGSPTSPFVRKCVVVAHELGLTDRIEMIEAATTPLATAPEVIAANPLGKIPALMREDGPAIYDSRVITQFLNAEAGADLYPEAFKWEILTLEATADATMEAAVLMTYEARLRDESARSQDWVEAQWGKASRALDAVQDRWMSHLSGPLNITQIGMACALGYIDFRHDARNWREGRDELAAWFETFAKRESFTATMPG
ncbi:glutathione S-transferase [Cognatishimia sp.]|uniref:glutathione S-transferase n=1 Tax=Cognatishimia sp. TaxID=2211648 RepID=UPI003515DD3A